MNLISLRKSRKGPAVGDVFAMQFKQMPNRYYFGRVVKDDAAIGGFENVTLIYIYKKFSTEKNSPPTLTPKDLLVAPMGTNVLAWRKGYFETIANAPIRSGDLLPRHVFRCHLRKCLFDDSGEKIKRASGLIGDHGLHSYQTIDDELSEALNLPLSP